MLNVTDEKSSGGRYRFTEREIPTAHTTTTTTKESMDNTTVIDKLAYEIATNQFHGRQVRYFEVEPEGKLWPDPEAAYLGSTRWCCRRATMTAVHVLTTKGN